MAVSRVIEVSFGRSSVALVRIDTAYFYNNGILFKPTDIDLPASYQVHWADSPQASTTLETIGTAEGAPIPDDLWNRSRVIYGWIYLHPTNDSSITGYEVRIYKNVRAGLPDGTEPTPAEQSTIDQLIGALNSAVEQTGEDVESAEQAKDDAESARDNAQTYANNAQSSAQASARSAESASESAMVATEKATASAQSASQSAQIKADVEGMVDDAQGYADSASQSASQASASEQGCARAVLDAASAAAIARARADEASGYAQTASTKASEAVGCVETATQKATESAQSASQALSYKTDAESAKTASQTAQGLAESARDTAVSAKDDTESARDDAVQAKEDAESAVASISGALADKAPVITDTASGAIASFSDGADNLPLKSLVVDINPVQDLHGQDAPYPAGGGKNLLIQMPQRTSVINGVTWTINSDGSITANGTASGASTFNYIRPGDTTDIVFDGDYKYIQFPFVPITVMNIGVKFTSWYSIYSQYVSSINGASGKIDTMWFQIQDGQTANVTFYPMIYSASETQPTAWSPYENICPISGWTEVNVNHSDADMTNPTTLTINLGQTVYGGHLDVLSGVLTVDRAMVDLGTFDWTYNDTYNRFVTSALAAIIKPSDNTKKGNIVCSLYKKETANHTADLAYDNTIGVGSTGAIVIRDTSYTDATAFKAMLTANNAQLVYELATPITIQLTPNQVNSLLGVNNIWADSGDTSCEYRADTKLFIERLTAPDSADMIADANITSGQYFMVGNSLYKATANIANGSAIVVGTNCIRKSLSEALNEINA